MLSSWLYQFSDQLSFLNVFRYITFKSFISFFTAFFVCWILGPYFIKKLVQKQVRQNVRKDGPESHLKKQGTPTMGGVLILTAVFVSSILWMDVFSPLLLATLGITLLFGLIGYVDDSLTIKRKSSKGLPGKMRLFFEFTVCIAILSWLVFMGYVTTDIHVPFLKNTFFDLGYFYILFGSFVIVGCANAVNLSLIHI